MGPLIDGEDCQRYRKVLRCAKALTNAVGKKPIRRSCRRANGRGYNGGCPALRCVFRVHEDTSSVAAKCRPLTNPFRFVPRLIGGDYVEMPRAVSGQMLDHHPLAQT
jgi:hypothetical protein